jgi:ribonuclease HI
MATAAPLTTEEITKKVRICKPGDRLNVRWAFGAAATEEWCGTVVESAAWDGPGGWRTTVVYDQLPGQLRFLPPARDGDDDDDDVLIFELSKLDKPTGGRMPREVGFAWRALPGEPDAIIWFDGGCREGGCASAVVAQVFDGDAKAPITEDHSMFFVGGTNNLAEHVALCAAARLAKKFLNSNPSLQIAIVGDSLFAVQQTAGSYNVRQHHLLDIVKESRATLAICPSVALCQAPRAYNKLADSLSTLTIENRRGTGDESLFPTPTPKQTPVAKRKPTEASHATTMPTSEPAAAELTLEDLFFLRCFPVRLAVPRSFAPLWGKVVHNTMRAMLQADDLKKASELIRLMALPSLFLRTSTHSDVAAANLRRGRPQIPRRNGEGTFGEKQKADTDTTARAERFSAIGQLRKAAQALQPAKVLNPTPDTIEKLRSKYPDEDASFRKPVPLPHVLKTIPVDVVRRAVTAMNPAAASGMDRWNSGLLIAAARGYDEVWELTAEVVHLILAKPFLFKQVASFVRGVALEKEGGDVRPIGVGGFWTKLASLCALSMDDPIAGLPPWQKGCAKRGTHQVIRKVRKWLDEGGCALTVDISNAFNSFFRRAIDVWIADADDHDFLRSYWHLSYVEETTVMIQDGGAWKRITARRGSRQGDPAAGYFFAVALGLAVDMAKKAATEDSDANPAPWKTWGTLQAYFDDISILTVDPRTAAWMLSHIVPALRDIGLEINSAKCELVHPDRLKDDQTVKLIATRGCQLVNYENGGVKILGATLGTEIAQKAYINKKGAETLEIVKRCIELGERAPRTAIAIIRFCTSPKMRYRYETHDPSLCEEIAVRIEEATASAIRSILRIPESPEAITKRDIIFTSFATNVPAYSKLLREINFAANSTVDENQNAQAMLIEKQVQVESGVLRSHAHLAARLLQQRSAASYLFSPYAPTTTSTADFRLIASWFLGFNIIPQGTRCMCNATREEDDTDSVRFTNHLLECPRVRRCGMTFRHNVISAAVGTYFSDRGYLVTHEPRFYETNYDSNRACRPDITIYATPPVAVDVTVSRDAAGADLAKIQKHQAAIERSGHIFVPLPIGSLGQIGERFDQLLEAVFSKKAQFICGYEKHALKKTTIDAWITGSAGVIRNILHWNITGDWEAIGNDKQEVYEACDRMRRALGVW